MLKVVSVLTEEGLKVGKIGAPYGDAESDKFTAGQVGGDADFQHLPEARPLGGAGARIIHFERRSA